MHCYSEAVDVMNSYKLQVSQFEGTLHGHQYQKDITLSYNVGTLNKNISTFKTISSNFGQGWCRFFSISN